MKKINNIKVAIVHDSLNEFGGAERLIQGLLKIFPKAVLFISYYKKDVINRYFPSLKLGVNFKVSWFQYFPRKTTTTIQFLSPIIWKTLNLKSFDLIITSSGYYFCNLINSKVPTIHYIHSIPKNIFGIEKKSFMQKLLPFFIHRNLYINSLKNSKYIVANSKFTRSTLKKLFGVNSTVIYPPINKPKVKKLDNMKSYYLIISRIDETKSIEIAIKSFNHFRKPLVIVGESNDKKYLTYLKKISNKNIIFLGAVSDRKRENLYRCAKAFIFCSKNEDFGIAPLEAVAHGVPVIAFYGGGVRETISNEIGLFYYKHNWKSLLNALVKFEDKNFDWNLLKDYENKYALTIFSGKLKSYIKEFLF